MQDEDRVAALDRLGPGDSAALLVSAAVPNDDTAAVRRSLEVVVADGVSTDGRGGGTRGAMFKRWSVCSRNARLNTPETAKTKTFSSTMKL